jgi:hypothetical protein
MSSPEYKAIGGGGGIFWRVFSNSFSFINNTIVDNDSSSAVYAGWDRQFGTVQK